MWYMAETKYFPTIKAGVSNSAQKHFLWYLYKISVNPDSNQNVKRFGWKKEKKIHGLWQQQGYNNFIQSRLYMCSKNLNKEESYLIHFINSASRKV